MALFRNFGVNHALGVTFLDRKLTSTLKEIVDGH